MQDGGWWNWQWWWNRKSWSMLVMEMVHSYGYDGGTGSHGW